MIRGSKTEGRKTPSASLQASLDSRTAIRRRLIVAGTAAREEGTTQSEFCGQFADKRADSSSDALNPLSPSSILLCRRLMHRKREKERETVGVFLLPHSDCLSWKRVQSEWTASFFHSALLTALHCLCRPSVYTARQESLPKDGNSITRLGFLSVLHE